LSESLDDHFDQPRISALFDDLVTGAEGEIVHSEFEDRVVVTWHNVREYEDGDPTFQVEMYYDGRIRIAWAVVTNQDAVVGLSDGKEMLPTNSERDFSDAPELPTLVICDASQAEGDSGSSQLEFEVALSRAMDYDTEIRYAITSETAIAGQDFVALEGENRVLTIPAGQMTATINIEVIGDEDLEADESLHVTLTQAIGAIITNGAIGTIENNDFDEILTYEEFTGPDDPFDLQYKAILFTPNAPGMPYSRAIRTIQFLPTRSISGSVLSLEDDESVYVGIAGGRSVNLYGTAYSGFYVGCNGYITFNEPDHDLSESPEDHFDQPRISALFDDLISGTGGKIVYGEFLDRVVVTWWNVLEYEASDPTLQIEMYFDGRIQIAWLDVTNQDGLVGLSDGRGVMPGYQEQDLSESPATPVVSISDASQAEGDDGSRYMEFSVTLSQPSDSDVTVRYATAGGTATEGQDFITIHDVLSIQAGLRSAVIRVEIIGERDIESDEQFFVILSQASANVMILDGHAQGTIQDDEQVGTDTPVYELFDENDNPLDLANRAIMLTPDVSGKAYAWDVRAISALPTSPTGAEALTLGDDDSMYVALTGDEQVTLYGETFKGVYVNSNGNITFTGPDTRTIGTSTNHFDALRISALFDDLVPSTGFVGFEQFVDRIAVTWESVAQYGADNRNSFQIEMYFDGRVQIAWLDMAAKGGLVGLSDGRGQVPVWGPRDISVLTPTVPTVSIENVSRVEGDTGITHLDLEVMLSSTSAENISVSYTISNGTATAVEDYDGVLDGTLVIQAGQLSKIIRIDILGDTILEADETFYVTLNGAVGAQIKAAVARCTIVNDDSELAPPFERFGDGNDIFDMAYSSILFEPDASGAQYTSSVRDIWELPTEPAAGQAVALAGDESVQITLAGGKRVKLFGQSYSSFYINRNGTITFDGPDAAAVETIAEHLSTLRIAGLFDDLNPSEGQITWHQLTDRAAVSWLDTDGNSFQVEMYYDGRVRIAWLAIAATDGLIGLSNGRGILPGYAEQDLSAVKRIPIIEINDLSQAEGDHGTTIFEFDVTLSCASAGPVAFTYTTSDNTASAGQDYLVADARLTIQPHELSGIIQISINTDTTLEADETFFVRQVHTSV
jgi:hypothetical protein